MKLSELERSGEIERLKVARKEIVNLIGSARTKLADARIEATSRETRLGLAYQCILTLSKAALRASGYRLKGRVDEHVRTLNTMRGTLGIEEKRLRYFQALRKKRHRDLYEGDLKVSATELAEALERAATLLVETERWLKATHPDLFEV